MSYSPKFAVGDRVRVKEECRDVKVLRGRTLEVIGLRVHSTLAVRDVNDHGVCGTIHETALEAAPTVVLIDVLQRRAS